jgi:hypothetical protein
MNPLVGRGIGLLGALLLLISPFPDLTDGGPSLWDSSDRIDVIVLLGTLAAAALIVADLTTTKPILLLVAGGIGLFLFGVFFPILLESDASATGTYLGTLGAVLLVAGSLLAYLVPAPAPAAGIAPAGPVPAAAATPAPESPAPAPAPEPARPAPAPAEPAPASPALPPAGWYEDPSRQARLRYWDGQAWTEQTSA